MKKLLLSLFALGCIFMLNTVQAQNGKLSNELIWGSPAFNVERVYSLSFQNDGRHYTRFRVNQVKRYDILGEEEPTVVFDLNDLELNGKTDFSASGVEWGPNEQYLLIATEQEQIYRRSSKANYIVHHLEDDKSMYLDQSGKQMYPSFNPQADKVAYVKENNIYIFDPESNQRTQVTSDGKWNEIINGAADWVYEEELSLTRAFEWSPSGNYLAYIKFDETEVPQFDMKYYRDGIYPETYSFKYPKVSQTNSEVKVMIYDLQNKATLNLKLPEIEKDFYIPRIQWIPETDQLVVFYLNRLQNELTLVAYNVQNGEQKVLLKETNERYINIHDDLTFLPERKQFLWTSEKDGWNHVYLYDYNGNEIRDLTPGQMDCTTFYGYDSESESIFVQLASKSPLQREIFSIDINTAEPTPIEMEDGWNTALFSPDFKVYIHGFETMNDPPVYLLKDRAGDTLRTLISNNYTREEQKNFDVSPMEPFTFNNKEGDQLNGFIIRPNDLEEGKEYPVLMHLYGGPNSQQVTHRFKGRYYWWFQMLVKEGYIVACVDNRGTGARGEDFRKQTYLQLGKLETEDQIDAAKYLADMNEIDQDRISIFGWSYGGYLSSLSLLKGNEVFNAAVAVAPVTNWKWYDSIYTERYMRRYEDNPKGYDQNAPMFYADRLKGAFLLIHGLADDNVHFQHSAELMNALMHQNKQFDSYVYPNEAHGINGGYLRVHLFNKITTFLSENLQP